VREDRFVRSIKDVLVNGLGDKAGEFAFLASAFVGKKLAQGFVEFFGDNEVPAGGIS
jgi:hypothetical protein